MASPKPKSESARSALVRAQVLSCAAQLFADQGFAATSKQDIADAVGIGRTSLYYYFRNKEAILEALVEDVTIYTAKLIKRQRLLHKDNPPAQLRGAIQEMMERILENPVLFKVLDRNEKELPEPIASAHIQAKKAVAREISAILEQGVQQGFFGDINVQVSAYTLIGMVTWSAWWYNSEWAPAPNVVSAQVARLAVMAVSPRGKGSGTRSVPSALAAIREHLAFVERQIPERQD